MKKDFAHYYAKCKEAYINGDRSSAYYYRKKAQEMKEKC